MFVFQVDYLCLRVGDTALFIFVIQAPNCSGYNLNPSKLAYTTLFATYSHDI